MGAERNGKMESGSRGVERRGGGKDPLGNGDDWEN